MCYKVDFHVQLMSLHELKLPSNLQSIFKNCHSEYFRYSSKNLNFYQYVNDSLEKKINFMEKDETIIAIGRITFDKMGGVWNVI